MQKKKKIFQNS